MSLKTVHIVFVVAATLLSFGVSALSLWTFSATGGAGTLGLGAGWLVAGVGLVLYGRRVLRKLRNLRYL